MSRRRRRSSGASNNGNNGGGGGHNGGGGSAGGASSGGGGGGGSASAAAAFWAAPGEAAAPAEPIRPTSDPAALPRSLGDPPLTPETAAQQALAVVYEEAVRAATALAAVNGLLADGEPAE
jgi:hypothetical protein